MKCCLLNINGVRLSVKQEWFDEHKKDVEIFIVAIQKELQNKEGFNGFTLTDVNASGVQVDLYHEIDNHPVVTETLKYDCSNVLELIEVLKEEWERATTKESLARFKSFMNDILEYGCD